ncbi:MAG: hypothetical protein AUJ70_01590 [Candidatus Omnitrophica bacterium CG1_02_40_15]|nr:MAG: hypothetical protein AUJ70_01590 [Candidatus Omnitrophica bacterium CG1_02_40_15]
MYTTTIAINKLAPWHGKSGFFVYFMKNLYKTFNIAFLFILIGAIACQYAYCLRVSSSFQGRETKDFCKKALEIYWDKLLRDFINKGQYPFDYEASTLLCNFEFIKRILKGETVMPPEIEIHPSSRCNKFCRYCIGNDGRGEPGLLLERDVFLSLVEDAHAYNSMQVNPDLRIRRLRFTGIRGEPLVNPATTEAMQKAIDYGFEVGLVTNGILLTDKVRQVIVKGKFIQISLNAATPETFSRDSHVTANIFYKTVDNVKKLVKLKREMRTNLEIGLSFVITTENYKEIPEFVRLAKELEVDYARLRAPEGSITGTISNVQWKEIDAYLEELKKLEDSSFKILLTDATEKGVFTPDFKFCPAHSLLGFIGPDHNIYPCTHVEHRAHRSFGSLKIASFQDIWGSQARKKFIQEFNPQEMCPSCLTGQSRLNRFLIFLMQEYNRDSGFLQWLEKWVKDYKHLQPKTFVGSIAASTSL